MSFVKSLVKELRVDSNVDKDCGENVHRSHYVTTNAYLWHRTQVHFEAELKKFGGSRRATREGVSNLSRSGFHSKSIFTFYSRENCVEFSSYIPKRIYENTDLVDYLVDSTARVFMFHAIKYLVELKKSSGIEEEIRYLIG